VHGELMNWSSGMESPLALEGEEEQSEKSWKLSGSGTWFMVRKA